PARAAQARRLPSREPPSSPFVADRSLSLPRGGVGSTLRGMAWLTKDNLRQFASDGYLVLRNVVSEQRLAAADYEIDRLIAATARDEGDGGPGQSAWFPARSRLPRCDDVLRLSPALDIARELVSPNAIDHAGLDGSRYDHIQIAITVPPWSHIPGGPHIDGWTP